MIRIGARYPTAITEGDIVNPRRPVEIGFFGRLIAVVEEKRLTISRDEWFHRVVEIAFNGHRLHRRKTGPKRQSRDHDVQAPSPMRACVARLKDCLGAELRAIALHRRNSSKAVSHTDGEPTRRAGAPPSVRRGDRFEGSAPSEKPRRRARAGPVSAGRMSRCSIRRVRDRAWGANQYLDASRCGSQGLQAPIAFPTRRLQRQ